MATISTTWSAAHHALALDTPASRYTFSPHARSHRCCRASSHAADRRGVAPWTSVGASPVRGRVYRVGKDTFAASDKWHNAHPPASGHRDFRRSSVRGPTDHHHRLATIGMCYQLSPNKLLLPLSPVCTVWERGWDRRRWRERDCTQHRRLSWSWHCECSKPPTPLPLDDPLSLHGSDVGLRHAEDVSEHMEGVLA